MTEAAEVADALAEFVVLWIHLVVVVVVADVYSCLVGHCCCCRRGCRFCRRCCDPHCCPCKTTTMMTMMIVIVTMPSACGYQLPCTKTRGSLYLMGKKNLSLKGYSCYPSWP